MEMRVIRGCDVLARDDVQHIQRVAVERGASPRRRTSAAQDMDDARTTRARVRRARFSHAAVYGSRTHQRIVILKHLASSSISLP